MKSWKCPQCDHSDEISYDWLAEHGGPVCRQCDRDMELQPETADDDRAAVVERLMDKADAARLQPEDIDELVHEFAAGVAADVNNGGLEDQIRYLVEGIGAKQTERRIDELIDSQTRKGE